jgi:hypothetical protein
MDFYFIYIDVILYILFIVASFYSLGDKGEHDLDIDNLDNHEYFYIIVQYAFMAFFIFCIMIYLIMVFPKLMFIYIAWGLVSRINKMFFHIT